MSARAWLIVLALSITSTGAPRAYAADASLPQPSNRSGEARPARWHREDLPRAQPMDTPQRIVSLAPVITETLFLVGAGAQVVGVTRFCDRPEAATRLPQVGGYVDPSLEKILALKPDLVVAMPSFGQRELLDRLRERGVPVLVVFADTLAEVRELPASLGDAVRRADAGRTLRARFDEQLGSLTARKLARPTRVLVVVGVEPIVVAGPGTFADELVILLGAVPVAQRDGPAWPQWSIEAALLARPDVVVAAEGEGSAAKLRALLPGVRVVAAKQHVLMRPGLSLLDDAQWLRESLAAPAPITHPTQPTPLDAGPARTTQPATAGAPK